MSQSSIAPSKFFRGSNKGTDALIGREKEFTDLDAAWAGAGKKNVVTIIAWGGIGKTSLVAHWAAKKLAQPHHSGIERYFDWSFYSQGTRREGDATGAAKAASADLFLKKSLEFFGDPALAASNASAWQKGERLAQLIGQHRTLLILDGIEPLQDAKTGELRDDGLRALLRGLAAHNHGLCLVTTRQHSPELAIWHQTTAPEWELARLTDEAGAALLMRLGVNGTDAEKRDLSARVKGHALTLTLLGNYLRKAHHGDIRRVDRVDFQKVSEKEQGGHAFRVIAAYERWFEENNCRAELAILRMLGLFDRPATPDCLAALRDPPIPGLTDVLASLTEDDWNEAVTHLVELDLVGEQPWEPSRIVGYSEEEAKRVWAAAQRGIGHKLGKANPFEIRYSTFGIRHSLDAHPLIREFFAARLKGTAATSWKEAQSRLFQHLRASAPYWPEGLESLLPLYQAIAHACEAKRFHEACSEVYRNRIQRGARGPYANYSAANLGAIGTDLAALAFFFDPPWTRPALALADIDRAWLLNESAYRLRASGRVAEAYEPTLAGLELFKKQENWKNSAILSINLSELELMVRDVASAVHESAQSVTLANRSSEIYLQLYCVASHANALHQAGRAVDAQKNFGDAEGMQRARKPKHPLLTGLEGFWFCDFLLAEAERAAWRSILFFKSQSQSTSFKTLEASCLSVEKRAAQTLKWWTNDLIDVTPLKTGIDHLTLNRARLYRTILECPSRRVSTSESEKLDLADQGLRQAGQLQYVIPGLLTRAWLRAVQSQADLARADLDEAWQIAERGPMRLHLADIHLHRARLFFREKPYPWKSPQDDLAAAEKLINDCGYHRRDQELADAKLAILGS